MYADEREYLRLEAGRKKEGRRKEEGKLLVTRQSLVTKIRRLCLLF
jgi:hypothetical protein